MNAIAPNLTILVGELVGARLISHAGSLINLAKYPSSTVQILGAEKALFRALKTKHDTPKYGLIYHASLIGQSQPKYKGKISRMLAAKASLAIRYDALGEGEESNTELAFANRLKIENRLRQLEKQQLKRQSGGGSFRKQFKSYDNNAPVKSYNPDTDAQLGKRKHEAEPDVAEKKVKTEVSEATPVKAEAAADENGTTEKKKKKKKKVKEEVEAPETTTPATVEKKKKKKKIKTDEVEA